MRYAILTAALFVAWPLLVAGVEPTTAKDLATAVTNMRRIDPSAMTKTQQEAKAKELDEAAKTLIQASKEGATTLKDELK